MSFSTRAGVRGTRQVAVFSALSMLFAIMPVFFAPLPALAAHTGDPLDSTTTSAPNPNLAAACGIDVLFVLDETGSMSDEEEELVAAVQAFRASLEGTLSRIGIIEFSSLPESSGTIDPAPGSPQSARDVTGGYLAPNHSTLTGYTQVDGVSAANTDSYNADGFTSWQEALWAASEYSTPDLLIFFTDGDPNTVDGNSHVSNNAFHGYGNAPATEAAQFAAAYSNVIKGDGAHILGMGLGFNASQASRLALVSGPDGVSLPGGTFNVSTTDYVTFSDPDEIATALEAVSNQLCNTEINITKYIQDDPSDTFDAVSGTGSGFVVDSGWTFGASLSDNEGFAWVDAPPGITNGTGTVTFRYNLDDRGDTSDATITETVQSGYELLGGNCSIDGGTAVPFGSNGWTVQDIPDQATVDCDVYNQASFLTLDKIVVNDDGGTALESQFNLAADGPVIVSGNDGFSAAMVPGGVYTLSETGPSGYTPSAWSCSGGTLQGDSVTVPIGGHVICDITNNDSPPTLTLLKEVDNSNGGSATESQWTLTATRQGGGGQLQGTSGVSDQVMGGIYDLTESNGPDGYDLVGWSCDNGDGAGATVALASGDNVTCTVENASQSAELTLVKVVNNQYGTSEVAGSWNLAADGPGSNDFAGDGGASQAGLPAGDYNLSESGPAGWNASAWSCPSAAVDGNTVTLGIGDDITCTVTNSPSHPHLTLVKDLQLGQGANETEADFTLTANGPTIISVPGANADDATENDAFVGTYALSETGPAGYSQVGGWVCVGGDQDGDEITLGVDEDAVCTIINASDPAQVTLVKVVENNHGGNLEPADFQLTLNGSNVDQGANAVVPNTEYTVSELEVDGYSQVGEVSCTDDDGGAPVDHPFTADEGQEITCTITNEDEAGAITVVKRFVHVTDVAPDDFDLTITPDGEDEIEVLSGQLNELDGNETYTVGETVPEGWSQLSLLCEDGDDPVDHPIELENGQHVTCVITNGENPTITVEKIATGEDEATFDFTGDVGDFTFDENGGSETFDVEPGEYVVTETLAEFWSLTDVSCSDGASADLNSASASFDVDYGDHQTCSFTNEQLPKTIEVVAEGICDGPIPNLKWVVNPINFNGTEVDITWLDIDSADPLHQQLAQPLQGMMVWPGIVVDNGDVVDWPGWVMVDGQWAQGADGYEGTIPTATIRFSVDPDLVVMVDYPDCSQPPSQIIVEKLVEGDSPTDFAFTFTAVGFTLSDDTLAHGDQGSSGDLAAGGGYSVTEAIPSGWEQVSAVCSNGSDPTSIVLSVGETVTCTFTNDLPDETLPIEVLPFTGLDSDVLVALGIVLAMSGALALFLSRSRGRHEDLGR